MKITFLGAARQVTGSRTLVEWLPGRFFLVDCGMEQGENQLVMAETPVPAGQIEYVFLTHAHIDHSGILPVLVKEGFQGKIYATPETEKLCAVMLADSAHIQETDAAYQTKKNLRTGGKEVLPLYTKEDAARTMEHFIPCEYGRIIMVDEGLSVRFTDAGHLLGSSFIEFFLEEGGQARKLVCSGDVGNLNQPIIRNPQPVSEADYLLIESTYGTRNHEKTRNPIPVLTDVLRNTFVRGGSVIIPSFAIGRTQELLYFFREIKKRNLLPEYSSFPVYVDSPLANEATAVFLQCSVSCLDEETVQIMREGDNPIWFDNLFATVSSEESKALNTDSQPKVIIASGGMCEGGRIRHHLKHHLWNEKDTVLFVGYQAAGTLGRIIYDGAKTVKILGEEIEVHAEIKLLQGLSGHADRDGLLSWISAFEKKPSYLFVNHGDEESCTGFVQAVKDTFGIDGLAPCSGSEYDLLKGEWIRLTDPVFQSTAQNEKIIRNRSPQKEVPFEELLRSVQELNEIVGTYRESSNHEIRTMTERVKDLIRSFKKQ
ncbi:MAG: MBL fold metallo-hydrolase [Clostridia bacterium]|nr:MBL fold metallo-hydrolase [Clostridia bacterium]